MMLSFVKKLQAWFKETYPDLSKVPDDKYVACIEGKLYEVSVKEGKLFWTGPHGEC